VNAADGRLLIRLEGHKLTIDDVAFSPDGQLIVTASLDGTAREWNAVTGQPGFQVRRSHELSQ
jgi:WD40 repeat protein